MIGFIRRIFDPKERLKHALSKMSLPVLPTGHMRVLSALRSDRALPEVGEEIGRDPALTATLLRTVNSAAFGLQKRVASPKHAASLLGRGTLESLILGVVVAKALPVSGDFDHKAFWQISARRAATARALAERIQPRDKDMCFTAGLLQDMALPLLVNARPNIYRELLNDDPDGTRLIELEKERLDFDHAEVAGWLAEVWRFPDPLTEAIRAHHTLNDGPVPVLIAGLLHTTEGNHDAVVEMAADMFGLKRDNVDIALSMGEQQGKELALAFTR